ncbi:unnamed protein product, partial [Mesocestoides corti]
DYLEEPQLTFRINETPFTVSSYLNWVSNKPRPLDEETANSANSSISSRRGTSKRSSLSRLAGIGGHSSLGPVDIASQKLLFNAADPKSKPPPQAYDTSPTDGSWAALASVAEQGHKTSVNITSNIFFFVCHLIRFHLTLIQPIFLSPPKQTSAVFMPDKAAARHVMSRSCHAEVDEMDGPEIARLMRRFWPRDLNFFGASQNSSGRRSLCESRSSVASSTASKSSQRPTILNLRNVCEGNSTSTPLILPDFNTRVFLKIYRCLCQSNSFTLNLSLAWKISKTLRFLKINDIRSCDGFELSLKHSAASLTSQSRVVLA